MGESLRPDWSGRLRRLWRSRQGSSAPALIVSSPVNIKYLTGFDGTAGLLLSTPSESWLLVDGRYEQAAREAQTSGALADVRIRRVEGRFDRTVSDLASKLAIEKCGFEAEHVTVATLEAWRRAMRSVNFTPTFRWVEELRVIKDAF